MHPYFMIQIVQEDLYGLAHVIQREPYELHDLLAARASRIGSALYIYTDPAHLTTADTGSTVDDLD